MQSVEVASHATGPDVQGRGGNAGHEFDPRCGFAGSSTRLCEPQARPRARPLSRSRVARHSRSGRFIWYAAAGAGPASHRGSRDTVVPTSTGGWREEYAVGRRGRHPMVECCVVAEQLHPARLPGGAVKSVEPSTDPPAGLILLRLGLRAGRRCNTWCRFETGGPRPHEPTGRRRDRGPGRSQPARSMRIGRGAQTANAGPSAGRTSGGPNSWADIHATRPPGRSLMHWLMQDRDRRPAATGVLRS
ncbi:hypothetical protein NDU88_003928 [Pleurodeles waltl]|uniref:Uncharacterized protein n=1 Tax=Pleurodeles waltl TaxID=8319 RepID=A0AAV7VIQ6_PLEWA|nr:hypothetical protein NDU88_003928 [Pleurodeles waltl]